MKIVWLNKDLTQAIITIGQRQAHVRLLYTGIFWDTWVFHHTLRELGWWCSWQLDGRRKALLAERAEAEREGKEWVPVNTLPEARVLDR